MMLNILMAAVEVHMLIFAELNKIDYFLVGLRGCIFILSRRTWTFTMLSTLFKSEVEKANLHGLLFKN